MADAAAEHPIFIISDDKQGEREIEMTQNSVTFGRGEECDIVLPERQVSREHIRVYREGEQYFIEDLESKNGTWLNGQQIKGVNRLFDGDEIHLALAVRMQFIGSGSTAPLPFEPPAQMTSRIRIDPQARRIFIGGKEIDPPLSPPQYRLVELLIANSGRICTRDEVVSVVWPDAIADGVSEQAIDALVRRLRDRLAEIEPNWQYIVTVRGHGFRLDNPDA
ncbi:MAG: FHA domain-containing protein [Anaerolineae bacterium]|nr:FHA domain-containing protein [Anaerolineae bacterium]